jgi:uncharacterized protein (TIGR03437 family)
MLFFFMAVASAQTVTTIVRFRNVANTPTGLMTQENDGTLYGNTRGATPDTYTVFKLTLSGGLSTLFDFVKVADAPTPLGGPVLAADGSVYDGSQEFETNNTQLYKISPGGAGAIIHQFAPDLSEGRYVSRLILGSDGNTVNVSGAPAYIYYLSPTQINAIAPNVGAGPVQVTVTTPTGTSAPVRAVSEPIQPAFLQWETYAVATPTDYRLAMKSGTFSVATAPAKPGDVIILWGTCFGPTSPAAPVGAYGAALASRYAASIRSPSRFQRCRMAIIPSSPRSPARSRPQPPSSRCSNDIL